MSENEIRRILWAVSGVDGGCHVCEDYVFQRLMEAFPDEDWPDEMPRDDKAVYGLSSTLDDWLASFD